MPHLNALHKQGFQRGLVVVGVTGEEQQEVQAFVEKHGVEYPIGLGWGEAYDVKGIPHAFLIDPAGKVLWRGHPGQLEDQLLESALAGARPATFAAGLEGVAKLLFAEKLGEAHALAKRLLAEGKLAEDARTQAEKLCRETEEGCNKLVDEGLASLQAGRLHDGAVALERAAKVYAPLPRSAEAAAKVAELQKDPKTKRELLAGQKLAEAAALEKRRAYDEAYKAYKALAGSQSTTAAGKEASARAAAIEKAGKLGYMRGCGACEGVDAACPLHRKKKR